jgi:hypothetical protein
MEIKLNIDAAADCRGCSNLDIWKRGVGIVEKRQNIKLET